MWIDIECWLETHSTGQAALGDDRVYFAEQGDAERFAAAWGSHAEEWTPIIDDDQSE